MEIITLENGQKMQKIVDGEIVILTAISEGVAPIPTPQVTTIEEQLAQLKADNLILMDVLATMYEDMLAKGTV